jgi:hypothetical protein
MLKASSILDDVRVASPCSASWEEMAGTNRVRFCRHCQKSVYNLSAMSLKEAEAFVRQRESRTCIQFYRRADGTMLTDDCPVGLRLLRRAARRSWALLAGSLVATVGLFIGGVGFSSAKRPGALRQLEPFASIFEWFDPLPTAVSDPLPTASSAPLPPELPEARSAIRGEMCLQPPPPASSKDGRPSP